MSVSQIPPSNQQTTYFTNPPPTGGTPGGSDSNPPPSGPPPDSQTTTPWFTDSPTIDMFSWSFTSDLMMTSTISDSVSSTVYFTGTDSSSDYLSSDWSDFSPTTGNMDSESSWYSTTAYNQDCQFGNKIQNCNPDQPWRCYNNDYRSDCCLTCENIYVDVKGCEYGDKVGNCQAPECSTYSQGRKNDCCATCTTGTTTAPSGTSSRGSDSPDYLVPVIAAVGGVLFILLIVFIFLWWRRRKQGPENLSPIDEKTYNDYKLSKRAPMALPRDLDQPNKPTLKRSDSEEYAYINPNDVATTPESEKRRSGNDPLPPQPNGPVEYLELGDADKYGYLEPLGTFIKNGETPTSTDTNVQYKRSSPEERDNRVQYQNEQTVPHRLNTYQKFPADGTHSSPTADDNNSQSVKL